MTEWDIGIGPGFEPSKYKLDGVQVDSASVVQQKRGGSFEAVILDVNKREWASEEFLTLTEARRALCAKLGVVIEAWVHPAF
jgi:hypothetical protein